MDPRLRGCGHLSTDMMHIFSLHTQLKTQTVVRVNLHGLKSNAKLTKKSRIHLVLRADKQRFAMTNGKPNLLIDDYIKNIHEWEAQGGIGVHHTSPSNT